jgi:tetratricopeptide (TPR) repeat protein
MIPNLTRSALPGLGLAAFLIVAAPEPVRAHADAEVRLAAVSEELAFSPADAELRWARFQLRRELGDRAGARADLDALVRSGESVLAELGHAWLALDRGAPREALGRTDRALAAAPDHVGGLRLRSRALEALGRSRDAARSLTRALERDRASQPDDYVALVRLHLAAGDSAGARSAIRAGLERIGPSVSLGRRARRLGIDPDRIVRRASPAPAEEPATAGTPVVVRGPYLQLGTSSSVVVRWRTDVSSNSRVRYGLSEGALTETVTVADVGGRGAVSRGRGKHEPG